MLGNAHAQCIVGISLDRVEGEGEGDKTEKRKRYARREETIQTCPECKG